VTVFVLGSKPEGGLSGTIQAPPKERFEDNCHAAANAAYSPPKTDGGGNRG